MIRFSKVYKMYPGKVSALRGVNFQLRKGEFAFITGPSGAGKTTLLKLIFRAEIPSEGQIIVNGRNLSRISIRELPMLRRRIGVVFQDFKLLERRSVHENVSIVLEVVSAAKKEIDWRVNEALKYVKLIGKEDVMVAKLSGGEKQRVAIARALVNRPDILLADEPTGNLDDSLSVEIMDLFRVANLSGITVIVATHNQELINSYGGRVIELEKGKVASDSEKKPNSEEKQLE